MSMNTAPPRGQVPLPGCRGFRSLLAWAVLWGTVLPLHVVSGQCALPSGLQGRWLRASDGLAVTLTSSGLEGHLLTVGSTSYDRFVCAASNGADVFVFRLENEVDGMIGKVMGFFCWNLKKVTASTYLLYQLTPVATEGSFANDRAVAGQKESVPPLTDVCLTEPASLHPTLLLTLPSDAADVGADTVKMAGQQCPPEVFATYTYTKDGTGCTGTDSRLDFCEDRETARVNYTACDVRVLFSESGNLSCAASFTLAGTVFILLVNHDDSVDNTNYFRVVCLKMERDGESEKAVVYPRDCTATTGSHSLALRRTSSCPHGGEEEEEDEEENIIPLAVGVAVGIVVVIVIVVVVCVRKFLSKRNAKISPGEETTENGVGGSPDRGDTDVANVEPSNSTSGDNPTTDDAGSSVAGGRLPPLPMDTEKSAPLRS